MIVRRSLGELFRFAVTGAVCVGLNVLIVTVLTEYAHFHYLVSLTVCFFTVTFLGFVANRIWTFGKRDGRRAEDFGRYVVVTLVNLLVGLSLCGLMVERLAIPYAVAVVLISIAFVPISFVLHRRWSFGLRWVDGSTSEGPSRRER